MMVKGWLIALDSQKQLQHWLNNEITESINLPTPSRIILKKLYNRLSHEADSPIESAKRDSFIRSAAAWSEADNTIPKRPKSLLGAFNGTGPRCGSRRSSRETRNSAQDLPERCRGRCFHVRARSPSAAQTVHQLCERRPCQQRDTDRASRRLPAGVSRLDESRVTESLLCGRVAVRRAAGSRRQPQHPPRSRNSARDLPPCSRAAVLPCCHAAVLTCRHRAAVRPCCTAVCCRAAVWRCRRAAVRRRSQSWN